MRDNKRIEKLSLSSSKKSLLEKLIKEKVSVSNGQLKFPLSVQQQQMWVADQFDSLDPSYNNPAAIKIKGDANISIFEKCINEIIRRHSILRTSVHSSRGVPYQIIHENREINLEVYNINGKTEDNKEQEYLELLSKKVNQPFNLENELLLRAVCLNFKSKSTIYLLINFHHIISDGWSLDIFLKEFSILYESFLKGQSSPLPEIKYQYTDYISDQRKVDINKGLDYWKNKFSTPVSNSLFSTKESEPLTNKGNWEPFEISPTISKEVIKNAAKEGVTLFNYLMAAYISLLHAYSNEIDICVGTPFANRDSNKTQELIGYFVNTIVLRNNLEGNPNFQELLIRVKTTALDAFNHATVPFHKVIETTQPDRELNSNPLFETMLVMNNAPIDNIVIGKLNIQRYEIYPSTARFNLLLSFAYTRNGLKLFINYKTQMFERSFINKLFYDFQKVLKTTSNNPSISLKDLTEDINIGVKKEPKKFSKY